MLPVLHLDPAIEPAGTVDAITVLRDQPLQANQTGMAEQVRPDLALLAASRPAPDFVRLQCCAGCVAPNTKLLARNNKTWRGCSGSPLAPLSNCTRGQTNITWQNRTMTRHDALVWLSLAGLFAAYCATLWLFLMAAIRG